MGHVLVTMIGTHEDLDWIYENCTSDSSSESSAEQAFGYDYLSEDEVPYQPTKEEVKEWVDKIKPSKPEHWLNDNDLIWWKEADTLEPLFTKQDKLPWRCLIEGRINIEEVLDLRPRKDWYCASWNYDKKRVWTKEEMIEWFKGLPDDVTFFFGDAHL